MKGYRWRNRGGGGRARWAEATAAANPRLRSRLPAVLLRGSALAFLLAASGCATVPRPDAGAVHHVVLCWLKAPGNADHRTRIMEVSRSFRRIPGVLDVRVGEVLASDRPIVDDSFDVAITFVFADTRRLAEYVAHPAHRKATDEALLPLLKRVVVYDFKEAGP